MPGGAARFRSRTRSPTFDDNGQIDAPMLVVQMQPRKQQEDVVCDDNGKQLARFVYPTPSWA